MQVESVVHSQSWTQNLLPLKGLIEDRVRGLSRHHKHIQTLLGSRMRCNHKGEGVAGKRHWYWRKTGVCVCVTERMIHILFCYAMAINSPYISMPCHKKDVLFSVMLAYFAMAVFRVFSLPVLGGNCPNRLLRRKKNKTEPGKARTLPGSSSMWHLSLPLTFHCQVHGDSVWEEWWRVNS